MTAAGNKKIVDFLQEFAQNPGRIQQFKHDPRKVAKDSGLTDAQADVVATQDAVQIHDAIMQEGGYPSPCILVVFG